MVRGAGRQDRKEEGKNLKLKRIALLHWISFIASCPAIYLRQVAGLLFFTVFFTLRTKLIPVFLYVLPYCSP